MSICHLFNKQAERQNGNIRRAYAIKATSTVTQISAVTHQKIPLGLGELGCYCISVLVCVCLYARIYVYFRVFFTYVCAAFLTNKNEHIVYPKHHLHLC